MTHASIETIVGDRKSQPHQLIEVLQDIQEVHSYISQEAATAVSHYLGVPLIEVFRAASFYKALSLEPRGKNVITLCTGTACHVRGSNPLLDQAKFLLNLDHDHGGTTKDGLFTVECVNCLGACAIGPIAVLNGVYHSHMTWAKLSSLIASVQKAELTHSNIEIRMTAEAGGDPLVSGPLARSAAQRHPIHKNIRMGGGREEE